jgi:hypothetical protein
VKIISTSYFCLEQISLPQHPNPPSSLGQGIQFGGGLQQVVMNVGGQQMIVHQAPPLQQQQQQQQQQQAQVVSVRTANGQIVQVKKKTFLNFLVDQYFWAVPIVGFYAHSPSKSSSKVNQPVVFIFLHISSTFGKNLTSTVPEPVLLDLQTGQKNIPLHSFTFTDKIQN